MKKKTLTFSLLILLLLTLFCSQTGDYVVLHQEAGPIATNCYLLVDAASKEAALIDVGGPVDSLVAHIEENGLTLKYIFATHGHMDHMEGVPAIKEKYPDAKVGYNKADYEMFLGSMEWMQTHWDSEELAEMIKDPDIAKWFAYDLSIFKEADIWLEDNQTYHLGNLEIKTFHSPGHSAGSICFHAGNVLFSGDVLFYRQVGRTDLPDGSDEAIVQSVRRLYSELPDKTIVYPGHGQPTTIGSEKTENEEVTVNTIHL